MINSAALPDETAILLTDNLVHEGQERMELFKGVLNTAPIEMGVEQDAHFAPRTLSMRRSRRVHLSTHS